VKRLALAVVVMIGVVSCERFFTTSPLAPLARDPSTFTQSQLVAYARDALASGDETAMATAYQLLKDTTDPDLQLLAVDLAFGAAGLPAAMGAMISGLTVQPDDPVTVLDQAFALFDATDLARFVEASALLDDADDDVSATAEQYAYAAFGLIAAAAEDAGGSGNLDPPPGGSDAETYVIQAALYLDASATALTTEGQPTDLLEGFGGALGWTP
jgi:hypothetical protein